jgi:hypothetical protein
MRAGVTRLTTQWQSRVLLQQRDSLVLTLPNGTKQVQRLGRHAGFTLTVANGNFTVRLDSLQLAYPGKFARGTIGTSHQNRAVPYLVLSRPLVSTPEAARASGKPIVYVQGNIHGGEVEGKEAMQAMGIPVPPPAQQ